jgi:NAD(P)-dependent dehydrogenase (short-subunit alcohol dehydrogenase family)
MILLKRRAAMTKNNKAVALVTGGAVRIGRQIVTHLVGLGYLVVIHYNNSKKEADALATSLNEKYPGSCVIMAANFLEEDEVRGLIPRINREVGEASLLVNNAALFENDNLSNLTYEMMTRHHLVNVAAPLILSNALLETNKLQKNIINILDAYAATASTGKFISYALSKACLQGLTLNMARDLASSVRVNAIALGVAMIHPRQSSQHFSNMLDNTSLKIPATDKDIAQALDFILTTASLTGQVITLAGI